MSGAQTLGSIFCTFGAFYVFFSNLHFVQNLLRQFTRNSMQNLESVAQKMAELLHNYVIIM